jgi:hypothetical protein
VTVKSQVSIGESRSYANFNIWKLIALHSTLCMWLWKKRVKEHRGRGCPSSDLGGRREPWATRRPESIKRGTRRLAVVPGRGGSASPIKYLLFIRPVTYCGAEGCRASLGWTDEGVCPYVFLGIREFLLDLGCPQRENNGRAYHQNFRAARDRGVFLL